MKKVFFLFYIITFLISPVFSSEDTYMFRLYLTDKDNNNYSTDNPLEFLSEKSVERRNKQQILIDETDLPISDIYIQEIQDAGCDVVTKSKWMNTVAVHCTDSNQIEYLKKLEFIKDTKLVWKGVMTDTLTIKKARKKSSVKDTTYYGPAYKQIAIHKGEFLHQSGYKGNGMEIAVIDAGFTGIEEHFLLSDANIKGYKNFVYYGVDMFQSSEHGTSVLSCMATNHANIYVGTAPNARYWLLQSEDPRTEFPIEEDYWIAAAEYADSIGVDIINASLGYSNFDKACESYTYEMLDGRTAFISLGASAAVEKGIFVVASAGNEGNKTWRHITTPSDPEIVFTVGAIKSDSTIASFSSRGPTADHRIKPDVVAMGEQTAIINSKGEIVTGNGTSYSGPVMTGLVACLWQACPFLTNTELADIIRQSADRYEKPDNDYGHGIPNMQKAYEIAHGIETDIYKEVEDKQEDFKIKMDSVAGVLHIEVINDHIQFPYSIYIYDVSGKIVQQTISNEEHTILPFHGIKDNLYIVNIRNKDKTYLKKILI